ncbi:MAG TPA: hypothetical protein VLC12_11205 [Terriglobales bacterium]|nr:hypothetical protein [Terriglobales bacterium]
MDVVQQTARLLSPALFGRGRILVAPPSAQTPCWRVFGGGLTAEVREHGNEGLCSFTLKGPDGKILRQGVAFELTSGLQQAAELLQELSNGDYEIAA